MKIATIEVDSRGRAALGKVASQGTYKAIAHEDGSILLQPAIVMTAAELALRSNPLAMAEVEASLRGEDLIRAKTTPATDAASS